LKKVDSNCEKHVDFGVVPLKELPYVYNEFGKAGEVHRFTPKSLEW